MTLAVLLAAMRHYAEVVERVHRDETWGFAMNEMSCEVSTLWSQAHADMLEALEHYDRENSTTDDGKTT